jgi:hypothetical protein
MIEQNKLYSLDATNSNNYNSNLMSNVIHSQRIVSSPFYNKCILCCYRPNNCIYL